jgi:WhiB family redox-sensing transcriptional regulator
MMPERALPDRKAQTAKANAITATKFRQRIEAYRALTRDQGMPVKDACQRLNISVETAPRYEQQITGMTAAERRQQRMDRYAELRTQGLTQAQAAREIGISPSTGLNYDRAIAGVPAPDPSPRKKDLMPQHRLGVTIHTQDTDLTDWDWIEFASCRDQDTGLFIGPEYESPPDREYREIQAKRICAACPVSTECLARALRCRESGVWGGTNDDERRSMRRAAQRRQANAA